MNYEEIFDIFKSSYVGKEIRKDIILNRLFNAEDKEIIERFVTNIYIKYSVKAENINKKAEKNFEEIQIIEININNYRAIYDIYGILLSIIPYPILAIFRYNDRASFALSNRILAEDKNNKGKIYTSYLIKEEEIGSYLKIDIDNCQTMIDVYNKWIYNIDNVVAYYDRLDRIIEFIEIGFHIKSDEVLEKLESYITRDCGTYNMKPRDGWKSKLDKYSDNPTFVKKIETHILWEYLFENTFFRNKLENFSSWSDFKWACVYNNRPNDIYYSQYNSRMSENYDIYEEKKNNRRYSNYNIKTKVEIIKNEQVPVKDTVKLIKDKSTDNRNIKFSEYQEQLLQTLENEPTVLENADYETRDNSDFMLQAIEIDGINIIYASDELKNNEKFILEAIKIERVCLKYASDRLKNNSDFMLCASEIDERVLDYASDELKANKSFILKAAENSIWALAYATDELKDDKKFMLKVFKKIGNYTFAFASERLKCDKEFILKLLEFNYLDFSYVNYELRKDREFMMKAISKNAETIEFADYELRNDKEFVLQAIKINPLCFVYASDELKNNKEFMLQAIDEDVAVIEYAKDIFRDDEDVALAALEIDTYGLPLSYISDRLRNDKEFILRVVDINSEALKYLGDKLKNDKEFMNKINDIIEDRIILKINYVFKEEILYRNEIYGIVGYLEKIGINVLEKNGLCMKIAVVETGQISEYSNVPLNLITDTLKELEMKKMKYIIIDWKLYLSGVTEENLKSFDDYMRTKKRTYSIYKNKKNVKNIIIEYTRESIKLQKRKRPLYRYINKNFDRNDDFIIINLCEIQPNIMTRVSNVLHKLADKSNVVYRDYIGLLPQRNALGYAWHYSIKNNVKNIYMLSLNIFKVTENMVKQINEYLKKNKVEYQIETRFDDIMLTIFPTEVEEIERIINILKSNDIEYEFDTFGFLDDIESAPTSLWMFETSEENKEKISNILSEVDEKIINFLKELQASDIIIQSQLAPVKCNYGMVVDSSLQNLIETLLQSLNLKYELLDKEDYIES